MILNTLIGILAHSRNPKIICVIEQINFEESQFSGIKYSDEIFSALVECLADFGSKNCTTHSFRNERTSKIKSRFRLTILVATMKSTI